MPSETSKIAQKRLKTSRRLGERKRVVSIHCIALSLFAIVAWRFNVHKFIQKQTIICANFCANRKESKVFLSTLAMNAKLPIARDRLLLCHLHWIFRQRNPVDTLSTRAQCSKCLLMFLIIKQAFSVHYSEDARKPVANFIHNKHNLLQICAQRCDYAVENFLLNVGERACAVI